jgi:hypothetical protein
MDLDRRAGQTLGLVSLACAILAPLLIFLPLVAAPEGESTVGLMLLAPFLAATAIVTGWPVRRRARDPLYGRIGFVLGIVEVVLIALMVLLLFMMQDALNETL